MAEEENKLQKTEGTNTSTALIMVKNEPLLFLPELKDSDVMESDVLDSMQKQVVLATLNNPKIRSISILKGETGQPNTPEYDALVDIIALAIWTMGITEKSMTKEEQLLFIPIAIEEIKTFTNLTVEDVRIAFNRGSRRKYGDTLQMSITTINIWLSKYEEETKQEAMMRLKFVKPKQLPPPEITKEEKMKRHQDWLENIYKEFDKTKTTGEYSYYDFGNKLFDYLKKLGVINLSEKQQEKLWDMAVEELKTEYHPKNGRTYGQRLDFKGIYDILKMDEVDQKGRELIVGRAKKLTIKWLFKKYITEAKHIRDVIDDAVKKIKKKNDKNKKNDEK
jgi:hypothetical protein